MMCTLQHGKIAVKATHACCICDWQHVIWLPNKLASTTAEGLIFIYTHHSLTWEIQKCSVLYMGIMLCAFANLLVTAVYIIGSYSKCWPKFKWEDLWFILTIRCSFDKSLCRQMSNHNCFCSCWLVAFWHCRNYSLLKPIWAVVLAQGRSRSWLYWDCVFAPEESYPALAGP